MGVVKEEMRQKSPVRNRYNSEEDTWLAHRVHSLKDQISLYVQQSQRCYFLPWLSAVSFTASAAAAAAASLYIFSPSSASLFVNL